MTKDSSENNKESLYPRILTRTILTKEPSSADKKNKSSILPNISKNKKTYSVSSNPTVAKKKIPF